MNRKLYDAVYSIKAACDNDYCLMHRSILRLCIIHNLIREDDPWVAAALGCKDDADIPDVALEFFIADIKSGLYDMKVENDNPNPEPSAQ